MRTTIRLDDQLLQEVKSYAARTGQSMTAVIEDALREMFAMHEKIEKAPPLNLTIVSGQGLQAGVDLDDSAALLELMNGPNGSS